MSKYKMKIIKQLQENIKKPYNLEFDKEVLYITQKAQFIENS